MLEGRSLNNVTDVKDFEVKFTKALSVYQTAIVTAVSSSCSSTTLRILTPSGNAGVTNGTITYKGQTTFQFTFVYVASTVNISYMYPLKGKRGVKFNMFIENLVLSQAAVLNLKINSTAALNLSYSSTSTTISGSSSSYAANIGGWIEFAMPDLGAASIPSAVMRMYVDGIEIVSKTVNYVGSTIIEPEIVFFYPLSSTECGGETLTTSIKTTKVASASVWATLVFPFGVVNTSPVPLCLLSSVHFDLSSLDC